MSECGRGTLQAHGCSSTALLARWPPPAAATHELQLGHLLGLQLQSLHQINSYASQLADRPSAPACPPPVVLQWYQDVIHTLFILGVGADDIHSVRRVWACMWSRLVMRGCADSWVVSPLTISISRLQSYAVG